MSENVCPCGGENCGGVADNERHQCGGPREACGVPGCAECGARAPTPPADPNGIEQLASTVQLCFTLGLPERIRFVNYERADRDEAAELLARRWPGATMGRCVEANQGRDGFKVVLP